MKVRHRAEKNPNVLRKILFVSKWKLAVLILLLLLLSFLAPLKSFIMQWLIDSPSKTDTIKRLGFGIAIVLLSHIFEYASRDLFARESTAAVARVRSTLMQKLCSLTVSKFEKTGTEKWNGALTTQLRIISDDYFQNIFQVLMWGGMGVVAVFYMADISPLLLIIAVSLSFLPFVAPKIMSPILSKTKSAYSSTTTRYFGKVAEILDGFQSLIIGGNQKYAENAVTNVSSKNVSADYSMKRAVNESAVITSLIAWIPGFIVLTVGAILVADGKITIGSLVTANSLVNFIMSPMRQVANAYISIKSTSGLRKQLNEIMSAEEGKMETFAKPVTAQDIDVDNVSFSYPGVSSDLPKALSNVKLHIGNLEKIAIVGSSGCGKSTLMKLMCKMYDNYNGNISLGGEEIRSIPDEDYFNQVTYIPQDPVIFEDTLRSNICLGKQYTDEQIKTAVEIAGLTSLVSYLPHGLDTMIGSASENENQHEKAHGVSGGQKKKIAIARAMIRNSKVLFIDEVTSSLDVSSTSEIVQLLVSLPCTVVLVTHDIFESYMDKFDNICCISEGKIAEIGTYAELIKKQGILYEMIKKMKDAENE